MTVTIAKRKRFDYIVSLKLEHFQCILGKILFLTHEIILKAVIMKLRNVT